MTDRIKGFVTTLEDDWRDDHAEQLLRSIALFEGVESVPPVTAKIDDQIIKERIKSEIRMAFSEALKSV